MLVFDHVFQSRSNAPLPVQEQRGVLKCTSTVLHKLYIRGIVEFTAYCTTKKDLFSAILLVKKPLY